jgi:predicted AlkP superfamily phosphohydrolase/phosphomutase
MSNNKELNRKIVNIGIDGVPCSLLTEYMNRGIMPKLKEIVSNGRLLPMRSSLPEVSSVAWTSFLTGRNPAQHNIFGFMELDKNNYQFNFPNFLSIKGPFFWEELNVPVVVINVPQTYPASPINGVLISGFVALDLKQAVYPERIYNYLKSIDYRLDVDAQLAMKDPESFFKEIFYALEKRIEAIRYLYDNEKWQIFIGTITETDRLHHYFFDSATSGKYYEIFVDFYKKLDNFLYEMYLKAQKDQALFMTCSDHGFTEIKTEVYVNRLLMEHGYLKISGDGGFPGISTETRAFCLDPARVYIHRQGKYSRGRVEETEYNNLRFELKDLFETLKFNNDKVVEKVFLKEQIFAGEYIDEAPDLYILGKPGYDLKSSLKKTEAFSRSHFHGAHTYEDAHLFISAGGDKLTNISIEDIPKIMTAYIKNQDYN